ncbi:nitronate monooxygenase [Streptomyces sp. NPDC020845]|uniref:nitronate monooxygenase n=1 Tax=Streptomyces sp. NPDC020845 TaxID=3365096 RepID=UPI0037AB19CC
MGLSTAFTELFGVEHPIALAPMGGSAGGALTAAVSHGGGLGLLGSGNGDQDWLARELPVLVDECAGKPWGIGFQTWAIDDGVIARTLEHNPMAVMLSFGDPSPFVERVRSAGAPLIIQVTDMEEARRAVATTEALVDPATARAIVEGRGEDTERSRVLDIARASRWPAQYTARTLGHPFLDEWRGREDELATAPHAQQAYEDAVAQGEIPALPQWASQAIDLINDLPSAADLVGTLAAQAEDALARAGRR